MYKPKVRENFVILNLNEEMFSKLWYKRNLQTINVVDKLIVLSVSK